MCLCMRVCVACEFVSMCDRSARISLFVCVCPGVQLAQVSFDTVIGLF